MKTYFGMVPPPMQIRLEASKPSRLCRASLVRYASTRMCVTVPLSTVVTLRKSKEMQMATLRSLGKSSFGVGVRCAHSVWFMQYSR